MVEHIAQLVEHLTFNERVDGSSPSMLTLLSKGCGCQWQPSFSLRGWRNW